MEEKYTVSARKFRPQSFHQIVGQQHIVRTLVYALDSGRIAHGYLFSGTRGVGKTTTARILAKSLNCEKGPTSNPCLECVNCKEIAAGTSLDVMEIDGASNTGVDNIRDLRENVKFSPIRSKYKIYIIDEVHQISKAAFNALLKTLEEPPPHVIFIFATTELNKVPDTILSRCQCFEYKSISLADIVKQLEMIAGAEEVSATPGAIELLARRARGSMRDAQSLFDQAAAYGGGSVSEDDVKLILGLVDKSTLGGIMDAAVNKDKGALLEMVDSVVYSGADPALFVEELSELLRGVMAAKIRNAPAQGDAGEAEKIAKWAAELDFDEIQRFFAVLVETLEQMKRSHMPSLNLTMGLLKLTEKRGLSKLSDIIDTVERAQVMVEGSQPAAPVRKAPPAPPRPSAPVVDSNLEPAPAEIERAISPDSMGNGDLLEAFKSARPVLIGILEHSTVSVTAGKFIITVPDLFAREKLEDPSTRKSLEDIALRITGRQMQQVVVLEAEKKKDVDTVNRHRERDAVLKKSLTELPIVQSALEIFNGDVVEVKVNKDTRINPPVDA
ncbi:MAG: DNA polymerase III subunit gamma/tau [Nitrospinae bacterium]|nr:DNA polymerase III subunit gamma/tau [Nitrospinota bacterium]